jgi:site-specific DNA-methyltransferase (adenine-specific)
LKTVCDAIFGIKNFKNEIVWCYRKWSIQQSKFVSNHDIILFYSRTKNNQFNILYSPLSEGTLKRWKGKRQKAVFDEKGKRLATQEESESSGSPMADWWEISVINPAAKERLGYPTQKPKALLERIIQASSNEGDTILDAFCGCGTSIDAAESLNRKWIGIDIAPFAVSLIKRRLQDTYGDDLNKFEIRGTPTDAASAIKLWEQNQFAFEDWWLTELEVFATTYGKKGADKGIDGIGQYLIPKSDKSIRVAFQVKGGKVQSKDIDALMGVVALEKYDMGVLLTRHKPTKPMLNKAAQAGLLKTNYGYTYPKTQIMTLDEFFSGKQLNLPKDNITFKSAATTGKASQQKNLFS